LLCKIYAYCIPAPDQIPEVGGGESRASSGIEVESKHNIKQLWKHGDQ